MEHYYVVVKYRQVRRGTFVPYEDRRCGLYIDALARVESQQSRSPGFWWTVESRRFDGS